MAQKPETHFRSTVRRDLQQIAKGGYLFFEAIQQRAIRGTPDFILCVDGFFMGLELKAWDGAAVSPLQAKKLAAIGDAGGLGVVVHPENWVHWKKFIIRLISEAKERDKHDNANVQTDSGTEICNGHIDPVELSHARRPLQLPRQSDSDGRRESLCEVEED